MLLTITNEDGDIVLSLDLDGKDPLFDSENIITDTGVDVLGDIAGATGLYEPEETE